MLLSSRLLAFASHTIDSQVNLTLLFVQMGGGLRGDPFKIDCSSGVFLEQGSML